ncbi:MAG: adenosine deaminase [Lachnospirales bacterium]
MIDLHLHLDGSLSVELIESLAKQQQIALPDPLSPSIQASPRCQDLNEYLRCFDLPLLLLQTPEAVRQAVSDLIRRLDTAGLWYAEIRFAPQLHTHKQYCQEEILQGALAGLVGAPFPVQLILCCMRGDQNETANRETLRLAADYLGKGVCALDLAGAEGVFPTRQYAALFAEAREARLPFTIHAGEAAGPESIREAIRFGASRIGHGVRLREDPLLLEEILARRIPLEMCPTSNLQTRAVFSLDDYPLRDYLQKGLRVTVNTDNMTVSQTNLAKEYQLLSLTPHEIHQLLSHSIQAAFLPESVKSALQSRLKNPLEK